MYKKIMFGSILVVVIAGLIFFSKVYIEPYYNAHFTYYGYHYPDVGQDFVVGIEPHESVLPPFILNILKLAFYDRNIIVSNERAPNFIVRSEHIPTRSVFVEKYQRWNAPYITYSAERWTISRKRYRRNAPPLAEIVSETPKKKRELYFPFMTWCGLKPEKVYLNAERKKFLAYIASNCVKEREKLFSLIKKQNLNAEALGFCSNPGGAKCPPGWGNLDRVYAQYDFGFAMENHQIKGYITEKIINVFRGGAIPIYWGDSETVNKYFNSKAFIDVGTFDSLEKAADYIIQLSQDRQRIESIRQEPIFKDSKMAELFDINTNSNHPLLQEAARFIREEYFKVLDNEKGLVRVKSGH